MVELQLQFVICDLEQFLLVGKEKLSRKKPDFQNTKLWSRSPDANILFTPATLCWLENVYAVHCTNRDNTVPNDSYHFWAVLLYKWLF